MIEMLSPIYVANDHMFKLIAPKLVTLTLTKTNIKMWDLTSPFFFFETKDSGVVKFIEKLSVAAKNDLGLIPYAYLHSTIVKWLLKSLKKIAETDILLWSNGIFVSRNLGNKQTFFYRHVTLKSRFVQFISMKFKKSNANKKYIVHKSIHSSFFV